MVMTDTPTNAMPGDDPHGHQMSKISEATPDEAHNHEKAASEEKKDAISTPEIKRTVTGVKVKALNLPSHFRATDPVPVVFTFHVIDVYCRLLIYWRLRFLTHCLFRRGPG